MIDQQTIARLATRYQTSQENVLREYCQHLFLQSFYSQPQSEFFLFKGGTALRIIYRSPRFSQDLDFSGIQNGKKYEKLLENILEEINLMNIDSDLIESKATSGGWLTILGFSLPENKIEIKNEISFRKKPAEKELSLITSDFIPPYKIFSLQPEQLVAEKIQALLTRTKPRDIFDLYFILRKPLLRKHLPREKRKELINLLKRQKEKTLEKELRSLLPISFLPIIKNLPERIIKEL